MSMISWRRRGDMEWKIGNKVLLFLAAVGLLCGGTLAQSSAANGDVDEKDRGGFLENELPLAIISTTPAPLAFYDTETIEAQGDLAITVVFSRPVIALGQDFGIKELPNDKVPFTLTPAIPGRFRWVTTYIARWDPEDGWPLDMDVEFEWNKNLTTHDGLALVLKGHADGVTFTTPSLNMEFGGVASKKAEKLTEKEWSASVGLSTDILPEVPPDGVIELKFSKDVLMTSLTKHLEILNEEFKVAKELKLVPKPCKKKEKLLPVALCPKCEEGNIVTDGESPEQSSCAEVTIKGDLAIGKLYQLSLPEGTKYSEKDGPLKKRINISFGGLREFKIPFRAGYRGRDGNMFGMTNVPTRTLSLWLPHGLKNGKRDLEKFKNQITVVNVDDDKEIEFELTMEKKGIVRIFSTSFLPENSYSIRVEASDSVLDGFDLPLKSSAIQVDMLPIKNDVSLMETSNGFSIFEADQDWGRNVVAFSKGQEVPGDCPDGTLLKVFELPSSMGVNWALSILHDQWREISLSERMQQPPDVELDNKESDEIGGVSTANITEILASTGMVAYEHCRKSRHGSFVLMESFVQAMVIGSGTESAIVWVTSMKTGEPVEGAEVTAYTTVKKPWDGPGPEDFDVVSEAVTDADGKAVIKYKSMVRVHVRHENRSLLIDGVNNGYFKDKDRTNIEIIFDRKLVRLGETLHIKGYVLDHDGESWKPSAKEDLILEIRPSVSSGPDRSDVFPIEVDETYGSFEFRIPVAADSSLGKHYVSVGDKKWNSISDHFIVGDPRLPTVGLTLDVPDWAPPDSKIDVQLIAESFIGASIAHAEITLKWKISGEDLEGVMEVVSDHLGQAFATIDLGSLEKTPPPGSTLEIDAVWVGPTRELVEESASIKLELADIVASLIFTITTHMPGQEFGVGVSLTDLQRVELESRSVDVHLKKLPELPNGEKAPPKSTQGSEPLEGEEVESCTTMSDSDGWCRMKLPGLGNFALEACVVEGEQNATVCTREFIGKTAAEWKKRGKHTDHLEMGLVMLSKGPFKVGDTVEFGIENPYANARAFVSWGSSLGSEHKIIPLDDFGMHKFDIELGEMCIFNCGVTVGIAVPRQTEGLAFAQSDVMVSKLFDLAAPHFVRLSETVEVEQDMALDMLIPFPLVPPDFQDALEFVVRPGETETIKVEIFTSEDVEVTVIAVDKAVLQLVPLEMKDLAAEFLLDFQGEFGLRGSSDNLVSPKAIQALVNDFLDKKELHPWFSPSSGLMSDSWSSSRVDFTREEFLDVVSEFITEAIPDPAYFDEALALADSAGEALQAKTLVGGAKGPAVIARVQKRFVSTPLFKTTTSQNGVAEVNFTAPDNLGTFVIRAYASTGGGKFGSAQADLIVRREVSLTPSAPRFVRVGDVFEAGVVITVSGARSGLPTMNVMVTLEGDSANLLEILDNSEASVLMGNQGTSEIRFEFRAKSMGDASFKITADDGLEGRDALVINIPIEGLQEAVTVASSFAIDGGNATSWQEGLQLPDAVAGSGGVSIQAGVGRLPSILSMAKEIYAENPTHECPIRAEYALALAAIPFVTESYDVMGLSRNELERGTADVLGGMISNFTAALGTLQTITSEALGLQYALTCPSSIRYSQPEEPSLWENARAAWIMMELGEDIRDSLLEDAQEHIVSLVELGSTWSKVLEEAFVEEATTYEIDYRVPIPVHTVALTRAALGKNWEVPPFVSPLVVEDISLERLSKRLAELTVESQAYYVLNLLAVDPVDHHPDIKKAIDSWTSNFRVTGRSGYIAESQGSSTPASNVANSLVLMAMTRAGVSNPLIEKLANYVGSPPVGAYGFRVFSDFDKVTAMIALRSYDRSRGSTLPNLSLSVRSGETVLMKATFEQNSNPVESTTTPWADLDTPPKPLEFTAEGTGQVTLAASLTFIPKELLTFPTYRGIFLERAIRKPDSNGASLKKVPVGSVLDITVQLTTPDRLGLTTVRAMMPAGLEPVDPNADSSNSCAIPLVDDKNDDSDGFDFFDFDIERGIFTCPDQETRPSVVTFDFEYINAGTITITFRAVAATEGIFALPPVRAFVNDQPEVMGLSSAGELMVCVRCIAEEDVLPKPPKSCPNDCSNNGACNLSFGECVCLTGFTGDDCGKLVAS